MSTAPQNCTSMTFSNSVIPAAAQPPQIPSAHSPSTAAPYSPIPLPQAPAAAPTASQSITVLSLLPTRQGPSPTYRSPIPYFNFPSRPALQTSSQRPSSPAAFP